MDENFKAKFFASDNEFISDKDLSLMSSELAEMVCRSDATRGQIDVVVFIANGGEKIGTIVANRVGRNLQKIHVKSYKDDHSQGSIKILKDGTKHLKGKRILVIDDLSHTGASFLAVINLLKQKSPKAIYTAALIVKEGTEFMPDFFIKIVPERRWIVFEREPEYKWREEYMASRAKKVLRVEEKDSSIRKAPIRLPQKI